jgi:uncharacterized protein (DUF2235 family)
MPRKLILCFDGTNHQYAATNTNVVKLYAMLDRSSEDQLAYYQPGIGTRLPENTWGRVKRWVLRKLDLSIAFLLKDHVCNGYRFLMRYYRPGDEIFIFGFSRGAYTARVLAAMLYKVGLLSEGNEELIPFAWRMYKHERNYRTCFSFRRTFSRQVKVQFLGLWDTVSSIGWAWDPQHLQYTRQNRIVETVRHAVALDERRAYFVQNLWSEVPAETKGQDVLQMWFPGAHCDVGGGYPEAENEAGLSKIALKWMVEEAQAHGLRFDAARKRDMLPRVSNPKQAAPDAASPIHESLRSWWWLVEYLPKRIKDPARGYTRRWILHRGQPRFVSSKARMHPSVFERMQKVPGYKPANLPSSSRS